VSEPCTEDTCSLDLDIADGKLVGNVNLAPNGGLQCSPGQGVGVRLDPNACNGLTLGPQGFRYNEHDARTVLAGGVSPAPGIIGVSSGFVGILVNIDQFFAAYAGTGGAPANATPQIEVTTRTTASLTNTTCRQMRCQVEYSIIPRRQLSNGWELAIGAYQNRTWPAGGFSQETPFVQFDHRGNPFGNNRWLAGGFTPRTYTLYGVVLAPGQTLTAQASGSVAVVGPGQTTSVGNVAEFRFGVGLALQGWTIQ